MIGIFKRKNKKDELKKLEERKTKQEIEKICREIEMTNIWFETEVDDNLIEACIHQRKSLNARYRYLLEKLKPTKNEIK